MRRNKSPDIGLSPPSCIKGFVSKDNYLYRIGNIYIYIYIYKHISGCLAVLIPSYLCLNWIWKQQQSQGWQTLVSCRSVQQSRVSHNRHELNWMVKVNHVINSLLKRKCYRLGSAVCNRISTESQQNSIYRPVGLIVQRSQESGKNPYRAAIKTKNPVRIPGWSSLAGTRS